MASQRFEPGFKWSEAASLAARPYELANYLILVVYIDLYCRSISMLIFLEIISCWVKFDVGFENRG